ncbi:MAG TPA: Ig-like domain-containing protein [Bacteroidia bacterium]|nr:Ig-like domain-containing protein [Bacteroidia bacterium]
MIPGIERIKKFFSFRLILSTGCLVLLCYSCKKEDEIDPVIVLEKPASQITVSPADTILVQARITDNNTIQKVTVQLLSINFVPVSNALILEPSTAEFNLSVNYILQNPQLTSGTYLISVTASDGRNTAYAYREIYILALPQFRKSVFVLSKGTSGYIQINKTDSFNQLQPFLSLPSDYTGSSIGSRDQVLYVLGQTTGGLTFIDANTAALINSIPPNTPMGPPTFQYLHFNDNLNYISFYDGNIRAYDRNGIRQFEALQSGYARPAALLKTLDYVYVENYYSGAQQNRLEQYFFPGGNSNQIITLDLDIIRMFEKSSDELFLFGQKNGSAVLEKYNRLNNNIQLIRTFGNYQINAVYQYRNTVYYIATSVGLYRYDYDQNALSPLTFAPIQGIEYDPLLNEFFLSENNIVRVLDGGNFSEKYTLSANDSILNVLFLYDR